MKAHNMEMIHVKQSGEIIQSSLLKVPERYDLTPVLGRNINQFPFFDHYQGKPAIVLYNIDAQCPNKTVTHEFHEYFKERYHNEPRSVIRGDVVIITGNPEELAEIHWEL